MAVFPLFYGWWNLGRDVSMSPVEIAKAFKAPHTEGADANASVDKLLRQIGKRKARYGVVATTEFEGADSSRLNLTLGGGRMGGAMLAGWRERLDGLGETHGGVVAGKEGWVLVGLQDPDGIEVRLYTLERHTAAARA